MPGVSATSSFSLNCHPRETSPITFSLSTHPKVRDLIQGCREESIATGIEPTRVARRFSTNSAVFLLRFLATDIHSIRHPLREAHCRTDRLYRWQAGRLLFLRAAAPGALVLQTARHQVALTHARRWSIESEKQSLANFELTDTRFLLSDKAVVLSAPAFVLLQRECRIRY
jgi:hypothetical protein